jgi:hypothetical protein
MEPDDRNELDRLIDHSLAMYIAQEPLAGLEDRVLNRIRLDNDGRRRATWRWALAVPAFAAVILVVVISRDSRTPVAPKPAPIGTAHVETPAPAAPAPATIHAALPGRATKPTRTLPKRDQFPTPTPLTPEERASVAMPPLPPAALQALADLQKSSEEIRIEPLEIPPLDTDGTR